jgi:hypothetical protein
MTRVGSPAVCESTKGTECMTATPSHFTVVKSRISIDKESWLRRVPLDCRLVIVDHTVFAIAHSGSKQSTPSADSIDRRRNVSRS